MESYDPFLLGSKPGMTSLRRACAWLVHGWLLCQLASLSASPVAVCMEISRQSTGSLLLRTRQRGHVSDAPPDSDRAEARIILLVPQHDHPASAVLVSLIGLVAIVPEPVGSASADTSSSLTFGAAPQPRSGLIVPDAPPPRA